MLFSAFFTKPFNQASQKGQAVTEYLLILVIVTGIALGVIYQFSDAMKKYVNSYFGDYLACLLETGELPTLGGTTGPTAEGCNASFEPFSLAKGRPLIEKDGADGAARKSAGSASAGARRSSSPKVTRNRFSTPNGEAKAGLPNAVTSVSAKNNSIGSIDSDVTAKTRIARQQARNGKIRVNGLFAMSDEEKELNAQKKVEAKKSKYSSPRKLAYTPKDQKKEGVGGPDANVELSMGDYLRYILIAAIIIAIIVVVGGQLMQVRRNQGVE